MNAPIWDAVSAAIDVVGRLLMAAVASHGICVVVSAVSCVVGNTAYWLVVMPVTCASISAPT